VQSFTLWLQATMEIMCRNHSVIACMRHIYIGVILCAYPFVVNHTFNAMPTKVATLLTSHMYLACTINKKYCWHNYMRGNEV